MQSSTLRAGAKENRADKVLGSWSLCFNDPTLPSTKGHRKQSAMVKLYWVLKENTTTQVTFPQLHPIIWVVHQLIISFKGYLFPLFFSLWNYCALGMKHSFSNLTFNSNLKDSVKNTLFATHSTVLRPSSKLLSLFQVLALKKEANPNLNPGPQPTST